MSENGWKVVDLPHDWFVYDTNNPYADGQGWYRRKLELAQLTGVNYTSFVFMPESNFDFKWFKFEKNR